MLFLELSEDVLHLWRGRSCSVLPDSYEANDLKIKGREKAFLVAVATKHVGVHTSGAKQSAGTHSWDFCRLFSPLVCRRENIHDSPDRGPDTAPASPSRLHHSWLNTAEPTQHTLKNIPNQTRTSFGTISKTVIRPF